MTTPDPTPTTLPDWDTTLWFFDPQHADAPAEQIVGSAKIVWTSPADNEVPVTVEAVLQRSPTLAGGWTAPRPCVGLRFSTGERFTLDLPSVDNLITALSTQKAVAETTAAVTP